MGIFGCAFGAISSAISVVSSFVSSLSPKVGSFISGFAEKFISIVAQVPEIDMTTFGNIIDIACTIIDSICEFLGIETEDDTEVLGAKAEQSEKTLSDFDNDTEAYIKYLKEEIELDKEKFDNLSVEEKMACKAVGLALEVNSIEEKIGGIKISPECIEFLAKIQMVSDIAISSKNLVELLNSLKSSGIINMNDVVDYFKGIGDSDRIKTGLAIRDAISNFKNIEDTNDYIENIKQAVRQ